MPAPERITVIHVDDDPHFSELGKAMLEREDDRFEVITETNPEHVEKLLEEQSVDCVVTDYNMPEMDGIALLKRIRSRDSKLPVILFTGKGTEEVASRAISAGVTDYLQKEGETDQFTVLANRIRNAVEHRMDQRKLEQYQTVVETAGDAMYALDADGYIEIVNHALEQMSGYDREELIGKHVSDFLPAEQVEQGRKAVQSLREGDSRESELFTFRLQRSDGESHLYELKLSLLNRGEFDGSVGIIRDITEDRRKDELLSGLFEKSIHGISVMEIVTDEDGEPIDYIHQRVNERFEELTGLDADEVVGNRATEVIEGLEQTPFIEIYGEVAREGTTAQFEQYSAPLDRHYEVSAFSPRPGECISIFADITDRKKHEESLEQYKELVEYSPDLMVLLNEDMTVRYQSLPSPLLEWEPKDVTGENPLEHIHPDDHETLLEHFSELFENPGQIATTEFRAKDANDQWQWLESRGQNLTDDDGINGILAAMRRITNRKEQEQQLERYSEALEELQRTTQALVGTTDIEEAGRQAITAFEKVFDFHLAGLWLSTPEQDALEPLTLSERGSDLIADPPTYSAETTSLSWDVYQEQEPRYIEDMSEHEMQINPDTPIQSEVIVPLGQYGLLNIGSLEVDAFSDHEIRLIELWADTLAVVFAQVLQFELLTEREAAIRQQRNRLDEFASVISHDLRNPLNVATLRTELASRECDSEHLEDVTKALSRMEDLIDDLLHLARQGETVGEREEISLQDVVSTCWRTVQTGEATLVTEDNATVTADRSRLAQALGNLFRNAIEHGGESVTVSVGVTDEEDGFYVADDGPGIPDEHRKDIFGSGFTRKSDGTGFGLAIVKQICSAHGWDITATESESGGAMFEITGIDSIDC